MSENSKKLIKLLCRVFKTEESLISDDTSPKNMKSWDSFNTLRLVLELEKEFNIKLTLTEIVAVKNVKNIKEMLMNHGVKL